MGKDEVDGDFDIEEYTDEHLEPHEVQLFLNGWREGIQLLTLQIKEQHPNIDIDSIVDKIESIFPTESILGKIRDMGFPDLPKNIYVEFIL